MAEYIEREKALDAISEWLMKALHTENISSYNDGERAAYRTALSEIAELSSADVRPVVLCRYCKHKGWVQEPEHGKSVDYCRLIERCVDKQFFCAAGERKTNCGADMREES